MRQAISREMRRHQEGKGTTGKINQYMTVSGLVEMEATAGEDCEGNESSEINVAAVELGIDAEVTGWAASHILAKYEGGEEDEHLFIDEAAIRLGNYSKFPVLLTAGKIYVPFGDFETNMVQDPLTLEIGEINATAVAAGFEQNRLYFVGEDVGGTGESAGTFTAQLAHEF